jgi:ribosomal protein S6
MEELHRVLSLADEVIRHKVLRVPEKVYGPPAAAGSTAADSA